MSNKPIIEYKEYIKSAAITFIAGFALAVAPDIGNMTLDSINDGTLVGVLFAGVRTGIKGLLDMYIVWYSSRP